MRDQGYCNIREIIDYNLGSKIPLLDHKFYTPYKILIKDVLSLRVSSLDGITRSMNGITFKINE